MQHRQQLELLENGTFKMRVLCVPHVDVEHVYYPVLFVHFEKISESAEILTYTGVQRLSRTD